MIKNFKEWQKRRARLLDTDATREERKKIHEDMEEYEKKHPARFRKMREAKWENHFITLN
jgi:Spy/CpxP family protein refolding chaperone